MSSGQPLPSVQVLEAGNIAFLYRPKQGVLHPKSVDDLERSYFTLLPDDQKSHKNRVFNLAHGTFPMIVPGRALPEERDWAFVQAVGSDPKQVLQDLQRNIPAPPEPSGHRARPWARLAGEGRYVIARHEDHTHLAYRLRQPSKAGAVQRELEIKPEASYVIAVKEPYAPSEIKLANTPSYPPELRRKFDGLSFIPADPTSLLDYLWAQVLLVGARTDVEKELGIKLKLDLENRAEKDVFDLLRSQEKQAGKGGISIMEPMEKGLWE